MSAWMVLMDMDGVNTKTFGPKFGVLPVGVPLGSAQDGLGLPVQDQIWAWVPEPPKPVSSRHLPELGLTREPLDWGTQVWAPVPLQSYRSTVVPLAVPAPLTSRHLPR